VLSAAVSRMIGASAGDRSHLFRHALVRESSCPLARRSLRQVLRRTQCDQHLVQLACQPCARAPVVDPGTVMSFLVNCGRQPDEHRSHRAGAGALCCRAHIALRPGPALLWLVLAAAVNPAAGSRDDLQRLHTAKGVNPKYIFRYSWCSWQSPVRSSDHSVVSKAARLNRMRCRRTRVEDPIPHQLSESHCPLCALCFCLTAAVQSVHVRMSVGTSRRRGEYKGRLVGAPCWWRHWAIA